MGDRLISLGNRCQIALQLQWANLRTGSYPFDWLVADCDCMTDVVAHDFQGLFADRDYLRSEQSGVLHAVRDTRYNVLDVHQFASLADLENLDGAIAKQQRAAERFRDALRTNPHTYLLRRDITPAQAQRLVALIVEQYGPRFTLVALQDMAQPEPWPDLSNVIVERVPLAGEANQDATAHNGQWQAMFGRLINRSLQGTE